MATGAQPAGEAAPVDAAASNLSGRQPRRPLSAAVLGVVASLLVGAGFVSYAVVISRQLPRSKYANLVVYKTPVKAPAFDLAPLGTGGRVTSHALGDGPAVVNWFQSTCVACQSELGTFAAVADAERAKISFLGIDINDPSPTMALKMVRRAKADYPVGEAGLGVALATRFGVGNLPATVFVSATGDILGEVLGRIPRAELVDLLDNLAAGRALNS